MKGMLVMTLVVLLLSSCGGAPVKTADVASANFGSKPSEEEAQRRIRQYLDNVLIDPESLRLKCSPVKKGWGRHNMFAPPIFGWLVLCDVNSKNRMGGYAGARPMLFIINGASFTAIDDKYVADGTGTHMQVLE